jgi:peptide/nickel transport system ATP-binding protein
MSFTPLLLEIKNLYVQFAVYGGRLKVIDGVNFFMRSGERVGLVGETGCGKTTTMKAILRVLPTPPAVIPQGEIYFKGRDILKMNAGELQQVRGRGISMIFQDPTSALNPVFTVGQQLEAVIRHSTDRGTLSGQPRNPTGFEAHQRAIKSLQEVALADPERLLRSYPIQLSGGMRQRVCIGMALATGPELLIADEPGTSLDVTIQDQVLRLLRTLMEEKNTSVILITHTLGIVREMTERVYVMYAGNMVEVATTQELFERPLHPYTLGLMEAVPRLTGGGVSDGIPGRIPSYLNPPSGCRFHPRCPHAMDICSQEKPPAYRMGPDHEVACFLYRDDAHRPQGPSPLPGGRWRGVGQ